MKKYFNVVFPLTLCLSLAAATFITDTPASAQEVTGSISGRVVDTGTGQPVSGAVLYALDYDTYVVKGLWHSCGSAITDSNGYYTVTNLPTGKYAVPVLATGYAREFYQDTHFWHAADPVLVAAPADSPNIDFSLNPGGFISGRVIDTETGEPVSGALIWVWDYDSLAGSYWLHLGSTATDSNGYYTFTGTPTGKYAVQVHATGYATQWYQGAYYRSNRIPVWVAAPDDTPHIDFSLDSAGGSISGRVIDTETGEPVSYARIWVFDSLSGTDWVFLDWANTDSNGYYRIRGLLAGKYAVEVHVAGYTAEWYQDTYYPRDSTPVWVTVPADTPNINFSLEPGGTISGYVVDTETGEPVSYARIRVFEYDSVSGDWLFLNWADTDSDGYYRTRGLFTGEYGVQVHAAGYAPEWYQDAYTAGEADPVSVAAPNDTPHINFSIEVGVRMHVEELHMTPTIWSSFKGIPFVLAIYATVSVRSEDNQPIDGAQIRGHWEGPEGPLPEKDCELSDTTNSQGEASLRAFVAALEAYENTYTFVPDSVSKPGYLYTSHNNGDFDGDGEPGDTSHSVYIPHLDPIGKALEWLGEQTVKGVNWVIQLLPHDAFRHSADTTEQRKNALYEKLVQNDEGDAVLQLIDGGEYQQAIDKLNHDIRAKCDGSLGGNPKNDWITDPGAQREICRMIDAVIDCLRTLL